MNMSNESGETKNQLKISVIVPAHNEEKYIENCLRSIKDASNSLTVEVVVVLNRCTDRTESIAKNFGAIIVKDDSKNLSHIRNSGIKQASGDIIATIDADSTMSPGLLLEIVEAIKTEKYIGGGVKIKPERMSMGIFFTQVFVEANFFLTGLSAGVLWFKKDDFDAIGGFNEKLFIAEDIDLASRLKKYGKKNNKKFKHLKSAFIVTSCRKFDKFGDWHWFKFMIFSFKDVIKGFKGDKKFANKYFYHFKK